MKRTRSESPARIIWTLGQCLSVFVGVVLALGAADGCKKKKDETAKKAEGPAAVRGEKDPRAGEGTRDAPRKAPAAVVLTVDPDLKKKLADDFAEAKNATFDGLIKQVKGAEKAIKSVGAGGQAVYPQYLAAAESLKAMVNHVKDGKYNEIAPLLIGGFVASVITVKVLTKEIAAAGKRAAGAARSLKVAEAKKHARRAKSLRGPVKVAGQMVKLYGLALEAVVMSKSDAFRVGLFEAAVQIHAKADAATKKVIAETLKRFLGQEKEPKVKEKMDALAKKL